VKMEQGENEYTSLQHIKSYSGLVFREP